MPDQYQTYQSSTQQSQPEFNWQQFVYYIFKGIVAIPKMIYKIIWTFFWRYYK